MDKIMDRMIMVFTAVMIVAVIYIFASLITGLTPELIESAMPAAHGFSSATPPIQITGVN